LLDGDPVAPTLLIETYQDYLIDWLRLYAPWASEDDRLAAADEALFDFIRAPEAFDPARRSLGPYLGRAAQCDLLNLLAREARHHRLRIALADVEDRPDAGKYFGEGPAEELDRLAGLLSEKERQVFGLMRAGVRETEAYVLVLGLTDLPPAEQARAVKRVKERIVKRLRRAGRVS
jgi:hypothetical protein